jgi:hypothetical protein
MHIVSLVVANIQEVQLVVVKIVGLLVYFWFLVNWWWGEGGFNELLFLFFEHGPIVYNLKWGCVE